jgi:AAA domain/RepB DNA-primase from phage plasmid
VSDVYTLDRLQKAMQANPDVAPSTWIKDFGTKMDVEAASFLMSLMATKTETVETEATVPASPVEQVAVPDVRFQNYRDYLTAIFKPGDTLCFVGIAHNKEKSKEQVVNEFVNYETALTPEYFQNLSEVNASASIYTAMNTYPAALIGSKTGRTQENVVDVRALQADVDYNGAATLDKIKSSASVPSPSIVVESSPGKYQGIWLVDGISKTEAKPVMQAIAQEFQTDAAVAEVARVMRVPGFVNRKYDSAPVAKTVTQSNNRYTREAFQAVATKAEIKERKPEGWVNDVVLQHGNIYNQLLSLAGYYISEKRIDDPEMLYKLLKGHCEDAVDRDGKTPFQCNMAQVRQFAEKWANEFKPNGRVKISQPQQQNPATPPVDASNWRSLFRTVGQMEQGDVVLVIDGVLQEGTCFIGANPASGKTLIGLSFAKAICTGEPLFGLPQYSVKEPRTVIYLIPESRDRAFRKRCEAFRIPDNEKFLARTISAGVSLELGDPSLLEAVSQTNPVVFLDTASRFMKSGDENSAAQNRMLVNDVTALLAAGAVCVIILHHATKAAKDKRESMQLENMLRGTSDFGAMCDQAYGIRKDETLYANGSGPMEIDVVSLKDREQIGGLTSIRLAASYKRESDISVTSYINETGNFRVVSDSQSWKRTLDLLVQIVKSDTNIPKEELASRSGLTAYGVESELKKLGWHRVQGGKGGASPWHNDLGGACPYKKPEKTKLTIKEAVAFLEKVLAGTSPDGEYVPQVDIYKEADKAGVDDALLGKAKKRLGVVVNGKDKGWSLPGETEIAATPEPEVVNAAS